ncbi:MAG: hypothetical protein ACOH2F_13035 [Cellulomonas sp.]
MSASPLGTRSLKMQIGSTEFNTDVSNVRITSQESDSDFTSFADAAAGGAREYHLVCTATQDPADLDSIWNMVWTQAGEDAAITLDAYGGGAPSPTNPIIGGTVVISEPDGDLLGGEANASTTAKFTFDIEWTFKAKPTLTTAV